MKEDEEVGTRRYLFHDMSFESVRMGEALQRGEQILFPLRLAARNASGHGEVHELPIPWAFSAHADEDSTQRDVFRTKGIGAGRTTSESA